MKQSVCPARNLQALYRSARTRCFLIALSSIILSISPISMAQQVAATLTGTVTDPSGAVVPGATVVVRNDATGTDVRTVTTTDTGNFNITNLAPSHYTVTLTAGGFQTYITNNVVLNV